MHSSFQNYLSIKIIFNAKSSELHECGCTFAVLKGLLISTLTKSCRRPLNSRLGLIYKLFSLKSQKSVVRLYKSFVRPILEYSCLIWDPHTIGYVNKIERVQKRMCRMIPALRHLPYRKQLAHLKLLSLQARRTCYLLTYSGRPRVRGWSSFCRALR